MALREYERRILAEIEQHLSEDDPDLAGRMEMFGADTPSLDEEERGSSWRPWAVCAAIAAAVIGLLVMLVALTPGEQGATEPPPAVDSNVVSPDPGVANP
ncbi:hypothetical protein F4561_002867 [Lipingzhangella halophila]|uniref:DUF3040 domain-containing protein n=1 Tax=Lipingzhangella halophila TaxID=1783352 RepID=A0A7W7RHK6_9ACTN|nr:DUF3040 domain-containing protein [Lipingzhangella halophila]MBB4932047.1 hypothetical protein [Lipingzhangella halophila]